MTIKAIKTRLIERDNIQKVTDLLFRGGLSHQDVYSKITYLCHVDLDILTDVLYPSQAA